MNFFKEKYYQVRLSEEEIESAYEKAQSELDSDEFSKGLMAKAKAKSKGEKNQVESKYLDLRVEQILSGKLNSPKKQKSQLMGGKTKKIYSQALDLYKKGNFERAIENLKEAKQLQPNNKTILIGLAYNYSKIKDFTKALYYMEKAILSGYNNFDNIQTHEDFAELRKTEMFQNFVENGYKLKQE